MVSTLSITNAKVTRARGWSVSERPTRLPALSALTARIARPPNSLTIAASAAIHECSARRPSGEEQCRQTTHLQIALISRQKPNARFLGAVYARDAMHRLCNGARTPGSVRTAVGRTQVVASGQHR